MTENQEPKASIPPTTRPKKRRWLKRLIWIAGLGMVFVLGAVVYLQTNHAMQAIYLPLASKQLGGGRLSADQGRVALKGRLYLENPQLLDPQGQTVFSAQELSVELEPASLMSGGLPTVRNVTVRSPWLRVRTDTQGQSNLDFLTQTQAAPSTKATPPASSPTPPTPQPAGASPRPLPQVTIQTIDVNDIRVDYQDARGLQLVVADSSLFVKDIAPGQTGTFGLALNTQLTRLDADIKQEGTFSARGKFTQPQGGLSLQWDALLDAGLQTPASLVDAPSSVSLHIKTAGQWEISGKLTQSLSLSAQSGSTPVGQLGANILWNQENNIRQARFDIEQLNAELLNPMLAAMGPVQLAQAQIQGQGEVNGQGEQLDFSAHLAARQLSFLIAGQKDPTPALDLTFDQKGRWQGAQGILELAQADFMLKEKDTALLKAALSQPMRLALGGDAQNGGLEEASTQLNLDLSNMSLLYLKPWLALGGAGEQTRRATGTLNGRMTVDVARLGQSVGLDGQIQLAGLQEPDLMPLPTDLSLELKGQLDQFKALQLETFAVTPSTGQTQLARLATSGKLDLTALEGSFAVQVDCSKPGSMLERLGMANVLPAELSQSKLSVKQTLDLAQGGRKIATQGNLALSPIQVTVRENQAAPITLNLTNNVQADLTAGLVKVEPVIVELSQSTPKDAGWVEIKGQWPLGQGSGELAMTVRQIDLTPWLSLAQTFPADQALPSIPLEADETLTVNQEGKIGLQGQLRLGLPDPQDKTLSLEVEHKIQQLGQQIESILVELASKSQTGRPADRLKVEGNGQLGDAPQFKLSATVDYLDLEPYERLAGQFAATPQKDQAQAETKSSTAAGASQSSKPAASRKSEAQSLIEAQVALGRVVYKTAVLEQGELDVRMQGQATEVNLKQSKLSQGTLKAACTIDAGRTQPLYGWNLSLQDAVTSPLVTAFDPQLGRSLSGKASLNARGTAQGEGETFLKKMEMKSDFSLTQGRIHDYFVTDILAEKTGIDDFRDFAFDQFSGNINIRDGVAGLEQWNMNAQQQRVGLEGTVDLIEQKYDLDLSPAVGSKLAKKIHGNKYLSALLEDEDGFARLPLDIRVRGQKGGKPKVGLSQSEQTAPANLENLATGLLQGFLEKKDKKDKKD